MIKKYYPYEYAESVFMIDYQKLYQKGFRGIIFDIDNTLVHHGDDSTPEIDDLFRKIQGLGLKTLLLSNNDRGTSFTPPALNTNRQQSRQLPRNR